MPLRFAFRRPLMLVFLAMAALLTLAPRVDARPKYKGVFEKTYPKFAENKKHSCAMCHFGDDKKKRNHYAEALAKELGEKNVKDDEKIVEALIAIEDGECRTGQWKPLLERGIPPCLCGGRDIETQSYIARQLVRDK